MLESQQGFKSSSIENEKPINAMQSVFLRLLLPVLPPSSYTGSDLAEGLALCLHSTAPQSLSEVWSETNTAKINYEPNLHLTYKCNFQGKSEIYYKNVGGKMPAN